MKINKKKGDCDNCGSWKNSREKHWQESDRTLTWKRVMDHALKRKEQRNRQKNSLKGITTMTYSDKTWKSHLWKLQRRKTSYDGTNDIQNKKHAQVQTRGKRFQQKDTMLQRRGEKSCRFKRNNMGRNWERDEVETNGNQHGRKFLWIQPQRHYEKGQRLSKVKSKHGKDQ